jgi:hypothetical protein
MKNKLSLTLVILAMAIPALANNFYPTIVSGGTNAVAIGGTNAAPAKILAGATSIFNLPSQVNNTNQFPACEMVFASPSPGSRIVPIQVSFAADASTTGNTQFRFCSSVDRVNWVTNALIWRVAASNTSQVTAQTNLDTGNVPFWCLIGIDNTNATANITNCYVNAAGNSGQ